MLITEIFFIAVEDNTALKDLNCLVGKVEEMKSQRSMLLTQLRESILIDDITAQLVTCNSENMQTLFDQELQKHSRYVSLLS